METRIDCVFCGKQKHLYVNQQKGLYHCFRCGKGGRISTLFSFIPELRPLTPRIKSPLNFKKELLTPLQEGSPHWHYASTRGALPFRQNLFRYAPYPQYLVIGLPLLVPLKDQNFFFGRKVALAGPRYRYFSSPQGVIAKSFLGQVESAVIVEGIFDLFGICRSYPTIALLGKRFDEGKIKAIKESIAKECWVWLDKDALREAIKLTEVLTSEGLRVRLVHFSLIKDPFDGRDWASKEGFLSINS